MVHLITALRAGRAEHTPEAEPVLVDLGTTAVVLTLDDGERLEFDRVELCAALGFKRAAQSDAAGAEEPRAA